MTMPGEPTYRDFRFSPPCFSVSQLTDLLLEEYGLRGELSPLSGERDQNMLVLSENCDCYVLKVAGSLEQPATIDFQIHVLEHMRQADPSLGVPWIMPTLMGGLHCTLRNNQEEEHLVRLLTHVPGVPLSTLSERTAERLWSVGELIGRVVRALKGIAPPATHDFLPWDVMNGLVCQRNFLEQNLPEQICSSCMPFLERFSDESLPKLRDLPAQVIHNDLHAGNILYQPDEPSKLTGCIDFGDIVFRPSLMELSSTFGEFASVIPDTLAGFQSILSGYRSQTPLPDDHLPLLYDASLARAVLCAELATFRIREANFDPAIAASHLPGAIAAVRSISSLGRDRFSEALATGT